MHDFCSSVGVIQEKALRVYKLGDVKEIKMQR